MIQRSSSFHTDKHTNVLEINHAWYDNHGECILQKFSMSYRISDMVCLYISQTILESCSWNTKASWHPFSFSLSLQIHLLLLNWRETELGYWLNEMTDWHPIIISMISYHERNYRNMYCFIHFYAYRILTCLYTYVTISLVPNVVEIPLKMRRKI